MADKRPNILVFMTDQQHAATVGPNALCRTPHLNRLLEHGVLFRNAFTTCPLCTPARASALTGRYPHQHGMIQNINSPFDIRRELPDGIETLGARLTREGYRTAYAGKWHVSASPPPANGFTGELSIPAASVKGRLSGTVTIAEESRDTIIAATTDLPHEQTAVFREARAVNGWLESIQKDDRPFFLFASTAMPHPRWLVPEPYASMYDPASLQPWENFGDDLTDKPMAWRKHFFDTNFGKLRDWPVTARALAKYFGLCTLIDDAFGTIVSTLERTGLIDNTLIVFCSDHGECMGRHGLIGKNELAVEDLIRVPLAAIWKDRTCAALCDEYVSLHDLYQTMLETAGLPPDRDMDSRSFAPALFGDPFAGRPEIFIEHHGGTIFPNMVRAIRTRSDKYVFRPNEIDEYYDLETDPWEMRNRISDSSCRSRIRKLRSRLLAWARESGDFAWQAMERIYANPRQVEFADD